MPAPAEIPIACTAHTLHLTKLAADDITVFQRVGRFALQFEHAFAAVLTLNGKDFIHRSVQVVDTGLDYFGRSVVHIIPIVAHHIGTGVQRTRGSPCDTSGILGSPRQRQAFLGLGEVFVYLLVYLVRSGFGHVGVGCLFHFEGYQRHFSPGAYKVEVTIGAEKQGFAFGTYILQIIFVSAVLQVVEDFVALVDDFIILSPIGAQRAVGGCVLEIIPHICLVGAVAGIASFFGILAAYHVYHESGYAGSDVIAAHQVVYVVHLSADKGVGGIVFGELSQWVTVEEVVTGCQGKGGECACYQG